MYTVDRTKQFRSLERGEVEMQSNRIDSSLQINDEEMFDVVFIESMMIIDRSLLTRGSSLGRHR
jgi:hypothetical protein